MKLKLFESLLSEETYINLYQKYYKNLFDKDDDKDLEMFNKVVRLDPTFNESQQRFGKYAKWLLKKNNVEILKNTLDEDLYKINSDLNKFDKAFIANKLPQDKKDINKFDINSLSDFIFDNFKDEDSIKSKSEEIREIKKQADKYKLNNWLVVIPKTMLAACYYGAHTKWCTAATRNDYGGNDFNLYNSDGELYIFINKKNPEDKYQFHFESFKLKDVENKDVNFLKFFDKNQDIFNFLVDRFNKKYPSEEDKLRVIAGSMPFCIIFVKNPSEAMQFGAVKRDFGSLKYIKNPSEELQLTAVKQNPFAIQYIKNPSEVAQLTAVKQNPFAIQCINNPSEEVQLEAVKQNGDAIEYIENPSEEVQLEAVRQIGYAIKHIENPSEKVQLAAVSQNGHAIQYIENPSEVVQFKAINENILAIQSIKNPLEKLEFEVVKKNIIFIQFIENPSEKVQLFAVGRDGFVIKYISNPSEEVQLAAVKQNGYAIKYIYKATELVQLEAIKQNCDAFDHIKNRRTQMVIDYHKKNCR